ncbi:MAG TPA: DUF2490 domain-containing protein [Steroidobacteraceae bacterium]|nr:DUF2490 domain-containing protein [Steroidobacteraceae bacterium]
MPQSVSARSRPPRSVRSRSTPTCIGLLLALAAPFLPTLACAGTGVPDEQLWTELDVTGPVATDTTLTGIGKVRFSESLPNPTLSALEADLNHKTGSWWLSLGYAHQLTPQRPEESIDGKNVKITQVVRLFGSRAWRFGRGTLALRLRLDDTLNASSNPYRARVRLEYRWSTEGIAWMSSLFANDEGFYEFQDQRWFRNRFRAGANLVLSEHTDLQVFYQRQDSNNSTPGAINALGLTLDVTFK